MHLIQPGKMNQNNYLDIPHLPVCIPWTFRRTYAHTFSSAIVQYRSRGEIWPPLLLLPLILIFFPLFSFFLSPSPCLWMAWSRCILIYEKNLSSSSCPEWGKTREREKRDTGTLTFGIWVCCYSFFLDGQQSRVRQRQAINCRDSNPLSIAS